MKKLVLLLALCCTPTLFVGCGNPATVTKPNPPLLTVAQTINQIQQTNKVLTNSVISSSAQGLVDDKTARTILDVAEKVAKGGDQAAVIVRGFATLPPDTKISVWNILKPISDAVSQSVSTGLIPIHDDTTKAQILALLTTIQTGLGIIQIQTGGQ